MFFFPDSYTIKIITSEHTNKLNKIASNYTDDFDKAVDQLRDELAKREYYSEIRYASKKEQDEAIYDRLMSAAQEHTGIPYEGDYIRWNIYQNNIKTSYFEVDNEYYYMFQVTAYYMTSKEQENEYKTKAAKVINSFNFTPETSSYEKVKTIYEYICKNVSYDYSHIDDKEYYLQYTAYSALINKKAVCQGFANLFYYLCLSAGVDCRIITGISHGENHAWNIVCINGEYYNVDSTWDSFNNEKEYFLINDDSFKDHKTDEEYKTDSFLKQFPKSKKSFKADKGDLNGDGKITSQDLVFLAKLISGKLTIDNIALYSGDLNNDNKISKADLIILSDYVCGLINSL